MWGWKNHLFPWLYLEENEGSVFFPCENLLVRTICTCKYIPCTCAVSLVRTIVHLLVRFVRANTFLARVLFLLYVQLYTCCVPTTSRYGLFVRLVRARKVFVRTKPCFVRTIQKFIRAPANQNQGSFSTCTCKRMFVCTITLSCTCKAYVLLVVMPNCTCEREPIFPGSIACTWQFLRCRGLNNFRQECTSVEGDKDESLNAVYLEVVDSLPCYMKPKKL